MISTWQASRDSAVCPHPDQKRRRSVGGTKQASLLQQAAEILFAGYVHCAFFAGWAGQKFVFYLEQFQPHDADILLAMFPKLALTQLHTKTIRIALIEHDVLLSVLIQVKHCANAYPLPARINPGNVVKIMGFDRVISVIEPQKP